MKDGPSSKLSILILGRPFLMIARTKINVHARTLSMEFNDNMVQLNTFEAMKYTTKNHFVFGLDVIDVLVDDYMQLHTSLFAFSDFVDMDDVFDFADLADFEYTSDGGKECSICVKICSKVETIALAPEVCLPKGRPKYSSHYSQQPPVLRKDRKAIGWTLVDLLGINSSICMHRILLEEEA
ncbi:hypothetical protein CR513_26338, partial [Mucuna pruriens]